MKLELQNYLPKITPHTKFDFDPTTWVVWANTQFDTVRFISLILGPGYNRLLGTIWARHMWLIP